MGTTRVPNWTVPFRRNPFFTGREEVLTQLHAQLRATQTAALSQPIAMSGLGGIGKTQTAVEYAYRYRNEYQLVYWIKSSTPEELAGDFASLASLLQLPEQLVQEQAQIIEAVKQWFETHSGWLLIFDNADNLGIIADYLPESNMGHMLITTRAHTMSGIAAKVELQTMEREDGIRLLLKRAGLISPEKPLEQVGEADLHIADRIFRELGGLPLALDQVGAYLEETGESLSYYLILYEQQRAELLQQRGGLRSDHAPVATTWTLTFQNIEDSNPSAIELIRLYAFLAPDDIPEELLTETKKYLSPLLQDLATNKAHFNDAIKALLAYSLIQRDRTSKTLSIHRLVQAVIRDEMSKTEQTRWAERVVSMISQVFPFDEDGPWALSQRYLSHALLATEYIRQRSFTFGEARALLDLLGIYFLSRGQYNEAEPLLQQFLVTTEKYLGPNHLTTSTALNTLGTLYKAQGRYEQAEALYQRALTICEQQLGPNHLETADILGNFAYLYTELGRYEEAESFIQRALPIFEQKQGPDHPDTAKSLNNLATAYTKQGKYEQAEPLYQRASAIFELRLGPNHPDTATNLSYFADFYLDQNKYEQAEPLYQRALAIFEQRLGPNHPKAVKARELYKQLLTKMKPR